MSDQLLPQDKFELSTAGQARSEEILAQLQGRLGRAVVRERVVRRTATGLSLVVVAAVCMLALWPRQAVVTPPLVQRDSAPAVPKTAAPEPVKLVRSEPAPEKYSYVRVVSTPRDPIAACGSLPAAAPAPVACELSDRQLLSALAETGSNFGLIRVNGKTVVVQDGRPMPEQGG